MHTEVRVSLTLEVQTLWCSDTVKVKLLRRLAYDLWCCSQRNWVYGVAFLPVLLCFLFCNWLHYFLASSLFAFSFFFGRGVVKSPSQPSSDILQGHPVIHCQVFCRLLCSSLVTFVGLAACRYWRFCNHSAFLAMTGCLMQILSPCTRLRWQSEPGHMQGVPV